MAGFGGSTTALAENLLPFTAGVLEEAGVNLSSYALVHINHDLDDVRVLHSLLEARAREAVFIPIPYARRTGALGSWRRDFVDLVADQLLEVTGPALIVEDGAYAIEGLLKNDGRQRFADLGIERVVEQTQFGSELGRLGLRDTSDLPAIAIVSCARSTIKCRVESQFLAVRLAEFLSSLCVNSGDFLSGRTVLLVGYGVIGRALALRLRDAYNCRLSIVDNDPVVASVAQRDGFATYATVVASVGAASYDLVLGATGSAAFSVTDLASLVKGREDRAVRFASVSSGEIEYSDALTALAEADEPSSRRPTPWGSVIDLDGAECLLLADGRPVNFFSEVDQSLSIAAADLINGTLVDALTSPTTPTAIASFRYWEPGTPGSRWATEEDLLRDFAECTGLGHGGRAVDTLRDAGLYNIHPAEDHLRRWHRTSESSAEEG